jgi:hypothetical protein
VKFPAVKERPIPVKKSYEPGLIVFYKYRLGSFLLRTRWLKGLWNGKGVIDRSPSEGIIALLFYSPVYNVWCPE